MNDVAGLQVEAVKRETLLGRHLQLRAAAGHQRGRAVRVEDAPGVAGKSPVVSSELVVAGGRDQRRVPGQRPGGAPQRSRVGPVAAPAIGPVNVEPVAAVVTQHVHEQQATLGDIQGIARGADGIGLRHRDQLIRRHRRHAGLRVHHLHAGLHGQRRIVRRRHATVTREGLTDQPDVYRAGRLAG